VPADAQSGSRATLLQTWTVSAAGFGRLGGMDLSEIRTVLSAFDIDPDDDHLGFTWAHDAESSDVYADVIVDEVETRGALWAACSDVASTVGACDYDESEWAVEAIMRQWERVADALDPCDVRAVKVRMAAGRLRFELDREELDKEMLPDLISICSLEDELRDHAAASATASEAGNGGKYVAANAARIEEAFRMLTWLKADLRQRGELNLEDEVLPLGTDEEDDE
jgi:hypothetical protein